MHYVHSLINPLILKNLLLITILIYKFYTFVTAEVTAVTFVGGIVPMLEYPQTP